MERRKGKLMNKKLIALLFASALSLLAVGCGQEGPLKKQDNKIQVAAMAKGPAASLAAIDNEVMLPVLQLAEQAEQGQAVITEAELQKIQTGLKRLQAEEIIRLNDGYLFFGTRYLQALEEYLQLVAKKETVKAETVKVGKLEDAKLGFLNARNMLLGNPSQYRLSSLEAKQLHKGMTYEEIRKMLQMPGEHLEGFVVTDYINKISKTVQPVIWVADSQYLYVEFIDGKSSVWKLSKSIDFGGKADKKLRKQIESWDEDIVQPVWKAYDSYRINKDKLAKQKIYNEAAARKQKTEIEQVLAKVKESKQKLNAVDSKVPETTVYWRYAEQLLKQIEERMQCGLRLSVETKNKKLIRDNINRSNHLEHWEIWRTYFVYANALKMKVNGKYNYQFSEWARRNFSKKPGVGNMMHWFRMPSVHLHRHLVQDNKNPKQWYRHDIHIWVQGNSFTYGYFVNDRLEKWHTFWLNEGFYHEK